MQWYMRLFHTLGFVEPPAQPTIMLDAELLNTLKKLAQQEEREVADLAAELLQIAITERSAALKSLQRWQELTPREKQTAALACLGFTNREIGTRMAISTNTVKTHMRRVLSQFDVNSKAQLRARLIGWDFSEWLRRQDLGEDVSPPPINSESPPGATP